MNETRAAAAVKRARYEVQLARDAEPAEWDDRRFEVYVQSVAANIISRGEDWRDWAAQQPQGGE